jgi:hypothetical protein
MVLPDLSFNLCDFTCLLSIVVHDFGQLLKKILLILLIRGIFSQIMAFVLFFVEIYLLFI